MALGKFKLVKNIDDLKNPGDCIMTIGVGEKITQLIICCPSCGAVSGSAGNHIFNEETNTYHPSIVHDIKLGGCGWHGWLTNGVFTSC